jgi:hypothetical protein
VSPAGHTAGPPPPGQRRRLFARAILQCKTVILVFSAPVHDAIPDWVVFTVFANAPPIQHTSDAWTARSLAMCSAAVSVIAEPGVRHGHVVYLPDTPRVHGSARRNDHVRAGENKGQGRIEMKRRIVPIPMIGSSTSTIKVRGRSVRTGRPCSSAPVPARRPTGHSTTAMRSRWSGAATKRSVASD